MKTALLISVLILVGVIFAVEGNNVGVKVSVKGAAMETAIFGAGCFWGVENGFRHLPGVTATRVGYAGGTTEHPTYEDVCSGRTGHTEVVEVTYDPAVLSYDALLKAFWGMHEPVTKHKAQYKSVIFYRNAAQRDAAVAMKTQLEQAGTFGPSIATDILEAPTFYPAEDYHQQYYEKRGISGTCH